MKNRRTKEEYEDAIKNSHSVAEALRYLGIVDRGGNYKVIKDAVKKYNIDVSHFTGQAWNIGLKFNPNPPMKTEDLLKENVNYSSTKLRDRLFREGYKEKVCECCGNTEWMGTPIALELHHVNGDNSDNRLENIQILCPNCHAMTDNYRGRNIKSARHENDDVEST